MIIQKVLTEDGKSIYTKLRLLSSIVYSVLLYGSESWKELRETDEGLGRFKIVCLRTFMKIRWYYRVNKEELRHGS